MNQKVLLKFIQEVKSAFNIIVIGNEKYTPDFLAEISRTRCFTIGSLGEYFETTTTGQESTLWINTPISSYEESFSLLTKRASKILPVPKDEFSKHFDILTNNTLYITLSSENGEIVSIDYTQLEEKENIYREGVDRLLKENLPTSFRKRLATYGISIDKVFSYIYPINPIKELRESKGYSASVFAAIAGLPVDRLHVIERKKYGFGNLTVNSMYKIASGLHLSVETLYKALIEYEETCKDLE